jgi:tetratricopeptide (TPR) repeat protein
MPEGSVIVVAGSRAILAMVLGALLIAPPARADDTASASSASPSTAPAGSDMVSTRDGQTYQGTLHRSPGHWTMSLADGSTVNIDPTQVTSISLGSHAQGKSGDTTDSALASLRRSLDAVGDPAAAVIRCKRFIELNPGTDAARTAQQDLAQWQQRLDQHLVRVGTQWVTPDQRDALRIQAALAARQAALLMAQNQPRDAEAALKLASDDDPDSVSVLYLRGLMQYDQKQLPAARRTFEAVNAQIAHAPTLNNLAVVLYRQNQQIAALRLYEQAVRLAPLSRQLLDNVAEALEALPDEQRAAPAAMRLQQDFSVQDQQLQSILAKAGLYRWGSTWVDAVQLRHLQFVQREVDRQLADLQQEMDGYKDRMEQIQRLVSDDQQQMQQLLYSQPYFRDANGQWYQLPPPQQYYDLGANISQMQVEYGQDKQKLTQYKVRAKKINQLLPVPKYTGNQAMIGAEGLPYEPEIASAIPPWPVSAAPPQAQSTTAPLAARTSPVPAPTTLPSAWPAATPALVLPDQEQTQPPSRSDAASQP